MRKCFALLGTLLFSAAGVFTTGCSEKTEDRIADVIILSRDVVPFATEGGTSSVAIVSPSQWTSTCEEGWVTLTPEEGLLTISVGKNTSSGVRSATIVITTAVDEKQIVIEQAFSQQTVSLTVVAPEELVFDSEEDSSTISVVTNGEWDVESNVTWLTATPDFERNTITIVSEPNGGDERPASITVTSSLEGSVKNQSVAVRQISRSDNPYYKLLGDYGLRAENWYYNGEPAGAAGTATFCTIEEKEYRKSFNIKNLFTEGTVIEAEYDSENNTLVIPLGNICMQITYSRSSQLITLHSMCQPGLPAPHGESQLGSPGLADFQSAKS